jgi:glycine cleavage system aminomethyltransferase T
MVTVDAAALGALLEVDIAGEIRTATVVPKPFYDPKKSITAGTA